LAGAALNSAGAERLAATLWVGSERSLRMLRSAGGEPAREATCRTRTIAINGAYPPFPLVPFGGFKQSGLGRELGPEGLANFLEIRGIGLPPALLTGYRALPDG
jgi:acyl-CoA reductase-like NAD-dependent aldehyde dehydrogenase